jgi:hypothetical protein
MMIAAAALCTLTVALGAVVLARRLFLIIKRSALDLHPTFVESSETWTSRKTCSVATLTIKQASATINCHDRYWRGD